MTGPTPANSTAWTTLADAVVNAEKNTLNAVVTVVAAYGYGPGSDVPVFTKTYTTVGALPASSSYPQAGEVAALVRYTTAARSTKNHPKYLFNYYHAQCADAAATPDLLKTGWRTTFQTYAALWIAGFSDGTNLMVRCGPKGDVATGYLVEQYLTHRDFPRG